MQLFYNPRLDNSASQFTFSEEESKHIVKVLRTSDSKKCKAEIIETDKNHQKMYWFHMVVAPTKMNDRFEWFLEKATEIGINEITPIFCDNSERKVIKIERMKKVIQSAMKQSLQTFLPKLNEPMPYKEYMSKKHEGLLFIAHCEDEEKLDLKRRVAADKDVTILIGPEGDFSKSEINLAYEKGFLPVSLSENRLRTETAAIVACTTVNMINNG